MNDKVAHTLEIICQKLLAAGYIFHDTEADKWPNCASLLCKEDAAVIVTPLPDEIGEMHVQALSHFTSRHSGVIMVGGLSVNSPEIKRLFGSLRGKYIYINPIEGTYLRHVGYSLLNPAPRAMDEKWCDAYAKGEITATESAIDVRAELGKHMAGHKETSEFLEKVNQATGFRRPQVTWVMIGIFAAIYIIMYLLYRTTEFNNEQLIKWGADQGRLVASGQYWRIITSGFIHANFMHILFNCLGCYYFGSVVEQYQGRARLVGIFLFAVITGNMVGLFIHPDVVAIGASGGLFGLIGMIAAMTLRYYRQMPHMVRTALKKWIVSILLYNVFFMAIPNVDISAHAGGLIGGFLMGLIVARPMGSKERPSIVTIAMALMLLILTANLGFKLIASLKKQMEQSPQTQPHIMLQLTPQQVLDMQQHAMKKVLIKPIPGKPGHYYIVGLRPEPASPTSQPQK